MELRYPEKRAVNKKRGEVGGERVLEVVLPEMGENDLPCGRVFLGDQG